MDRAKVQLARTIGAARRSVLVAAASVLSLLAGHAAHALLITPTFDSTIMSDPNAAAIEGVINTAINGYEADFTDPITVTINFREMTSGLGQSDTWLFDLSYNTFITALHGDAKTADDATALGLLPVQPTNPVTGSGIINVKTAEIRALNISGTFPSGLPGGYDGLIGLNTNLTDIGSPGTTGQYSLLSVAEHEIDEVLGLGSDVGGTGFFSNPAPEDLFRYDSAGNRSYTSNSTANAFFSINGTTDLAQFDNQNDGGDFGDWQSNPLPSGVLPKVQDAFATPGAHPTLGVELRALDVIGYDPAIPEPASLALLGTALAGFGAIRRHAGPRRRAAARPAARPG
jgi:hypothetical protein